jgi:hypothetical protein
MGVKIISIFCLFFTGVSLAQSNSFEERYKVSNPKLIYSYDEAGQIHKYSGNWDFDNDGTKDNLCFIGTGGAHLYFYLQIVLSSDKIVRNYDWILCDMPVLGTIDELKDDMGLFPQFVVSDFDGNGVVDIYVNFDETFSSPTDLKKKGITSGELLLKYQNGKMIIGDLKK